MIDVFNAFKVFYNLILGTLGASFGIFIVNFKHNQLVDLVSIESTLKSYLSAGYKMAESQPTSSETFSSEEEFMAPQCFALSSPNKSLWKCTVKW